MRESPSAIMSPGPLIGKVARDCSFLLTIAAGREDDGDERLVANNDFVGDFSGVLVEFGVS